MAEDLRGLGHHACMTPGIMTAGGASTHATQRRTAALLLTWEGAQQLAELGPEAGRDALQVGLRLRHVRAVAGHRHLLDERARKRLRRHRNQALQAVVALPACAALHRLSTPDLMATARFCGSHRGDLKEKKTGRLQQVRGQAWVRQPHQKPVDSTIVKV